MTQQMDQYIHELARIVHHGRKEFIEQNFRIIDKNIRLVPFKLQPTQQLYWDGKTRRDRILKHRQGMFSSVVHADVISEAMLRPGLTVLILVQKPEEETIRKHRERARLFYRSTADAWKPELLVDSFHQMQFGFPEGITSTVYYGSAGSLSIGRGETLNRVIREELSEWEDEEVESTSQMLMGLPEDSRVIDLGTPKKMGSAFYHLCMEAKAGIGNYKLRTFPWFLHHEYRLKAKSPIVDPEKDYYDEFTPTTEEINLMEAQNLDIEQIRWRRSRIDEALGLVRLPETASWDAIEQIRQKGKEIFWQEYLEDDARCWGLGGQAALPTWFLDNQMERARPPLSVEQIPGHDDYNGKLRMWNPPETGESYLIMADPAEGLSSSHLSAAVIRRIRDWKHVATLRGHISPGDLGAMMVELARKYNNALIGWERNNHGWGVQERIVEHLKYHSVYKYRGIGDMKGDERYGFPTNRYTKPSMVTQVHERMLMDEWSSPDAELIGQYRAMQETGEGRYDTGVLDIAMADLLCHVARNQAQRITRPRAEVKRHVPMWMTSGRPPRETLRERRRRIALTTGENRW